MATLNAKSLRAKVQAIEEQFQDLRQGGKVTPEVDALFRTLLRMRTLLVTLFLSKTSGNSWLPPSQTDEEGA